MLICSVSLRPPRSAIAADVAETAAALDYLGSGQVVFATLVDDPASVADFVDAYSGEIMLEAASAADTFDGVVPLAAAVIAEAASATDTQDASTALPSATLDSNAGASFITMSNGNLTATVANPNWLIGARSTAYKSSGKYYFEVTTTTTRGNGDSVGILLSTGTYTDLHNGQNCTVVIHAGSGLIYSSNSSSGKSLGSDLANGNIVGVAIDLTARRGWFRKNGGLWNNDASADPAAGTNGVVVATGSFGPSVGFTSSGSTAGDAMTANFGQSAYSMTPPSGFGNWTA
jgi:hypothetical protein